MMIEMNQGLVVNKRAIEVYFTRYEVLNKAIDAKLSQVKDKDDHSFLALLKKEFSEMSKYLLQTQTKTYFPQEENSEILFNI